MHKVNEHGLFARAVFLSHGHQQMQTKVEDDICIIHRVIRSVHFPKLGEVSAHLVLRL